jgi:hypothetical protein
VAKLFEIVGHTVNNRRAQFVIDANKLASSIAVGTGSKPALQDMSFNEDMSTAELKAKLTILSSAAGKGKEITALQKALVKVETDSIIASIIAKSRLVQEGQKLIIGIETDWIPGMNEKGYGSQHDAINPLLREIEDIGTKLKALGLDNVEIIHKSKSDLGNAVLQRAGVTNTNMSNIIILGSNDNIQAFIKNGTFQKLTAQGDTERAFLAGIDPTSLAETYAKAKGAGSQIASVNVIEMLSIALELALGKEPPKSPIIVSYDRQTRVVVFLPKAAPVDYDLMKSAYEGQRAALASL